jgi:copper resistance protein C
VKRFIALGLLIAATTHIQAHAFLDYSEPKVGSTVHVSPSAVKIWFTRAVDPSSSKIRVFDASGNEVDDKDSRGDAANKSLLSVTVPPLRSETYKVVWTAVALDTHRTSGSYTFTVTSP